MYSFFIKSCTMYSSVQIKIMQTISILGFVVSSVLSGYFADKYRNVKKQIYIGIILLVLMAILSIFAIIFNSALFLFLHLLSILVIPIYSCILQIYIKNRVPRIAVYSLYSLAHSVGSIILSSTTPMIANYYYSVTKLLYAPYMHLLLLITLLYCSFKYIDFVTKN